MRDLLAGLFAIVLLFLALVLILALRGYQGRRQSARQDEIARGRSIIAELPAGAELTLFTADEEAFHYGTQVIPKRTIQAARVLVNGSPIAAYVSRRFPEAERMPPTSFEDHPEGIARDRWDVAIETMSGACLIECGAIRERISQELARRIFDAVKQDLERRDQTEPSESDSHTP